MKTLCDQLNENSIVSFDGVRVIFVPVTIKLSGIVFPSSFLINAYLTLEHTNLEKRLPLLLRAAVKSRGEWWLSKALSAPPPFFYPPSLETELTLHQIKKADNM